MVRSWLTGAIVLLASAACALGASTPNLNRFVGQYRYTNEPEITISVFHTGDHLTIEGKRLAATALVARGNDVFARPHSSEKFVFLVNTAGKVTGLKRELVRRFPSTTVSTAERISDTPAPNHFRPYLRETAMIPMRDGVKLYAVILRPKDQKHPLPFLMERTPYGVDWANSNTLNENYTAMAQSGYIFVFEDIRGRYESQGKFVMMRPMAPHHDPKSSNPAWVDESTDAYDTVAWLLKHVPDNNGRVGVVGISYPGFLAAEAGIDPNPAVKAISPQAPMTDVWLGDDFFHNGAFRMSFCYGYVRGMESHGKSKAANPNESAYTYFLNAGSAAAAGREGGLTDLPTWQAFLKHPSYDSYWKARSILPHLTKVSVPTLEVGGYWDEEDMYGPQAEYAALKPHDKKHEVYLVLGPWYHEQWMDTTRHLGVLNFGSATGDYFREQIMAPFFAWYLKGQPGFDLKDVASFQTGSDRWMRYSAWPPKRSVDDDLYLASSHLLTFTRPVNVDKYMQYISNPVHPVQYRHGPLPMAHLSEGPGWMTWLAQNQRPYDHRPDVAVWETPVLKHSITVTGNVMADLLASTSGTDSDWVVKLIDVYPPHAHSAQMDNYQLMIAEEIFRGRYRTSFTHPKPIPANEVEEYKFSLHAADHVFEPGHRIMVQVQSSWFPLYDRNPQTFVPNIMTAQPQDYITATQRIYADSHIVLPVVGRR